MTALLAISPILLVLIGMTILKKPAMMVAPVAMVYTWVVSMVFFGAGTDLVIAQTKSGIMEGKPKSLSAIELIPNLISFWLANTLEPCVTCCSVIAQGPVKLKRIGAP